MHTHFLNKSFLTLSVFFFITLTTTTGFAIPEKSCHILSKKEVSALFNEWNTAVKTKNLDAIVAAYADNGVLLPTLSNTPRTNHAEMRAYFVEFLKKNPAATIDTNVINTGCNWASNAGLYTFQLDYDGKRKSVQARYSYVYELIDGKWLIVNHHSSLMPEKDEEAEGDL